MVGCISFKVFTLYLRLRFYAPASNGLDGSLQRKFTFSPGPSLDVKGSQFRAIDHRIRKKQLVPGR